MRARTAPWLILVTLVFLIAVFVLHGAAQSVIETVAPIVFILLLIRVVALAVRDDDVSSATIRGPAGRTLAIWGADSRRRRGGRRR
jgi:hypothetical protein